MSIQDRFMDYHAKNPHVYRLFVKFARDLKARGWSKGSAKLIIERMRWEIMLQTTSNDEFKISNDYTSRYARLAMDSEPDLARFFDVKALREAGANACLHEPGEITQIEEARAIQKQAEAARLAAAPGDQLPLFG